MTTDLKASVARELPTWKQSNRALTVPQINTLVIIGRHEPISAPELARRLQQEPNSETKRLASLERRGLVERQHEGLLPGQRLGWRLSTEGKAELKAADLPEDYDPLESEGL